MTSTYSYSAFGITVRVPFRCPALAPASGRATADVVVAEGPVPRRLGLPVVVEDSWEAEPGRLLLRGGARAGRFLVEQGSVTFERNPGADEPLLAGLFTGVVMAAVLRQHGMLVLHADAASTRRGVVVIAGEAGSGKSTTLAALIGRGCGMFADDLTVLRSAADGHVEVLPGAAELHLTNTAAKGLGLELSPELLRPWHRMKSAVATREVMAKAPGRLAEIFLLRPHEGSQLMASELTGAEKFSALQGCLYGPMFADEHHALFPLLAAVASQVAVYRLDRPNDGWSVDEIGDIVLASDGEGG